MGTVRDPPPFRRGRFVGQPIPRFEDRRFITGRGRYADDMKLDGAAHAVFVRSDHGHAVLESIDIAAAVVRQGRKDPGDDGLFTHQATNHAFRLGKVAQLSIDAGQGALSSQRAFFNAFRPAGYDLAMTMSRG